MDIPNLIQLAQVAGVAGPSLGAAGLFVNGRIQERRFTQRRALADEMAERRRLRDTCSLLRTENDRWVKSESQGGIPVVLAGNGGISLGLKEAREAFRGSAEDSYNPILLAQPDKSSRRRYMEAVHQLPGWTEKVIEEQFPRFPGFQDRRPSESLRPDLLPYWEPDLRRTVQEKWLPNIRRLRDQPRYLKIKSSAGGSGVGPLVVIEEFRKEFPGIPVYLELVLDEGDLRRTTNVPELLELYSRAGAADGITLYENRRHPWLTDQAQALFGPSIISAPWFDERSPEDFNVLGDVHRYHRFSTIRAKFNVINVEHRPAWRDRLPALYYTATSQLEFKLIQAIQDVLIDPTTQSMPLQETEPRFVYGIVPVVPEPDLIKLAQRVQDAVRPQLGFNTKLAFASIGKPLNPSTTEVGIAAVSVFPLQADLTQIIDYVTGKRPMDPRFISEPGIGFGG